MKKTISKTICSVFLSTIFISSAMVFAGKPVIVGFAEVSTQEKIDAILSRYRESKKKKEIRVRCDKCNKVFKDKRNNLKTASDNLVNHRKHVHHICACGNEYKFAYAAYNCCKKKKERRRAANSEAT